MNARQMFARFANGGDVSSGLKYATGEGGIGADKYYENIRNFFANTPDEAATRAAMAEYGVSEADIKRATGRPLAEMFAPARQGLDAGALASELGIPTFQVANLLNQGLDASAIRNRYAIPVSVATDLMQRSMTGGVDTSEFDRLGGYERVKEVYDAAGGSYTPPFGQKPVTQPPAILPPTQPLPPLTEEFVAPTAPLPQAPPVALTPGQEGLDPGTAIVGKIPESERVKIPQLDTEFRASAPRTAIYDRFGRITGYNYSPAAKLTPATGTNVFNFVPPGITSRPRSLLNLGDVPGVTIDPVTGQPTLGLSASQRFARDRAELDNQFRRLYARAAEADTSLPTQAPATAAAAFRNFAMSDPTMSAQLRMRDIEQTPTVNPTAAMTAARSEFGAAPYAAALTAAFDPFLARNKAALLASKDMQKSYFERYPDLVAEYEKNWSKTMSPEEYAAYHYRTLGQKEGRTPPNLMGSPYTQQFFSKGGEASTEDFIKKQSGGDVSRGTTSPTNPLDYTPGLSDKGLGAGFADPGVVEMIDRFDRNQLRSTPELTALDQLIASQDSNVLNQGLANTMSVDQITGDIDPVQSLRNLQAYDPASFEATLRTLQDVPSLVPKSGLGSLRLGMEQLQGMEGVTPTQVRETANAFATMLKQPETGSQVQDIAQNIRSIIENQPLAQFQTNVGFTPEGNVDPYAAFRRTGGISYKEPSASEDPLVSPIPPGFQEGGEVTTEEFIKKNVSRGTSEDNGERKQNIKLDSVQSLQDFLQSLPKGPPSPQPVEPDNVLPDVALKRKGAKELESYINALNPRAQVFDVPEGYQSSYRSSPFGLKGSGLVGSVPIREPDRINVLNTLTPGQRERVLLHEAEHSMSLRGGDIEGELDSKGRPIIMDNAFRAVALLKGNELPVREFVKNVALNKDKIDAFFGEPSFGSEFKKQSYEELRKRGRELALFEEQLASLSALEQATGKFLTQDKEMRKLLFPNTEMMSIFDALTGPRQTRMDARDLPPHTPMNPMSYETGNAISRFIAEKTRKPLLRELPEAKMRVK